MPLLFEEHVRLCLCHVEALPSFFVSPFLFWLCFAELLGEKKWVFQDEDEDEDELDNGDNDDFVDDAFEQRHRKASSSVSVAPLSVSFSLFSLLPSFASSLLLSLCLSLHCGYSNSPHFNLFFPSVFVGASFAAEEFEGISLSLFSLLPSFFSSLLRCFFLLSLSDILSVSFFNNIA
jgi:hypothetical protein